MEDDFASRMREAARTYLNFYRTPDEAREAYCRGDHRAVENYIATMDWVALSIRKWVLEK
jgi:hypothetical protein